MKKNYKENSIECFEGYILLEPQNIFETPIESKYIDIYGYKIIKKCNKTITINDIDRKMFYFNTSFAKDDGTTLQHIFFPVGCHSTL